MTWRPTRRSTTASTLGLIVIASVIGSVGATSAGSDSDAAVQAAAEIQDARDRANAAAEAYIQAQIELEQLTDEADDLSAELDTLQSDVDVLAAQVERVAINRFMSAGSGGITILDGPEASTQRLVTNELVATATNSSTESMDDYAEARNDLEDKQDELEEKQDEVASQQEDFADAKANAEAEVVRLQEIEAQRLEDERVRRILEAQRAEEIRQQQAAADAEAARAAREAEAEAAQAAAAQAAAAQAPPAPAPTAGPVDTSSSQQSAAAERGGVAPAPVAPTPSGSDDRPDDPPPPTAPRPNRDDSEPPEPPRATRPETAPPQTAPPQTAPPQTAPPRAGIACPVVGGSAYSDTWGASRSGGRRHEGVDMLAGTGTPLVAVVSGSVQFKQTSLGGNSVWLAGSDGNRYFYAHLSGFEGSSRSVSQGDVIGYVGDTGNARGTPHLHFEVRPGGGAAVNPYPYVRRAGC